jgi:GntR family transcriptional regulator / MocR family aminotransferase
MSIAHAHRALPAIMLSPESREPVGRQIYRQLRELIQRGRLRAGSRLPSTRQLAGDLGVSRNIVVFAYEELKAEGYIVSQVGAGSSVAGAFRRGPLGQERAAEKRQPIPCRNPLPQAVEPGFLIGRPFEVDLPALDVFPQKLWGRLAANRCARSLRELLRSADTNGYLPLRQAIAEHLFETRGIQCAPDQVIVVTGQGQAISLAAALLVQPNDAVLVENPTRIGVRQILRAAGARLIPVPVDVHGFDARATALSETDARIALFTPSSHFPLGFVLGPAQRTAIADWARAGEGRWILEDDTGHDLVSSGLWQPPLWSGATGRVLYFSSFRPTLAPSLRLGFVVVPDGLVDAMLSTRLLADGYRPPLEQAILNDFIVGGHYAEHVRAMRGIYAERHAVLATAVTEHLGGIILPEPSLAGLHTVCRLPAAHSDVDVAAHVAGSFVLRPLSAFHEGATDANALLLGHAQLNAQELRREVRRLAAMLVGGDHRASAESAPGHMKKAYAEAAESGRGKDDRPAVLKDDPVVFANEDAEAG